MRSATLKGLVIHTADEAGANPGPDYSFGWGLLNVLKAAEQISLDELNPSALQELTLLDSATIQQEWVYSGSGPFKATICWTDPRGTPPPFVLDAPDKMLVNDLDLRVIGPDSTVYEPWVLDPANPANAATKGDNDRDNVEVVQIDAPAEGQYIVRITHKGTLSNGAQDVSLVLTGAEAIGCGPCQLFGDVFPFTAAGGRTSGVGNCVVDIDDLLVSLAAFALSPNATKSTGGPYPDEVDMFPCGGFGGVVDIDDVVAELGAFAGNFACPHVCNPGACCGTLTDNGGNPVSCLDWDQQPTEQTPPGGMSLSGCLLLGGTYQGDGTTCAADPCK